MKNFLIAHKAWLSVVALGAISFLTPSINAFVTSHPQYSIAISTVVGFVAAWAKSPKQ
jgi:hypothetical protein